MLNEYIILSSEKYLPLMARIYGEVVSSQLDDDMIMMSWTQDGHAQDMLNAETTTHSLEEAN